MTIQHGFEDFFRVEDCQLRFSCIKLSCRPTMFSPNSRRPLPELLRAQESSYGASISKMNFGARPWRDLVLLHVLVHKQSCVEIISSHIQQHCCQQKAPGLILKTTEKSYKALLHVLKVAFIILHNIHSTYGANIKQ